MSLKFAILTALSETPSTGLGLARRFDRSIGYFWSASHQQIYRELDRLRGAELIRERPRASPPERGQPQEFEICPAGSEALLVWVASAEDPAPTRSAIYVKVRAAAALDPLAVRAALLHERQVRQDLVERYEEIDRRDFQDRHLDAQARLQRLVLKAGIDLERTTVLWCDEALAELAQSKDLDPTQRRDR